MLQCLAILRKHLSSLRDHCLKKIVNGDDVPQGSIDRVEFGCVALIGKKIWQHPFGNNIRPCNQDVSCIIEAVSSETQSPESNERITPPIGEPRIACDDSFACPALDDVCISGTMQPRGKLLPAPSLGGTESLKMFGG